MNFKNKIFSKMPRIYISSKIPDKNEAKMIYEGYKSIKDQNLFDNQFYLEKYPGTASMDPLLHYLFFGFDEGKKPNPNFDGSFYASEYGVDINPLIHYALVGKKKGYKPSLINKDLNSYRNVSKKAILFILHENVNNIGGTGFTTFDIIKHLDEDYQKFILTSSGEEVELWIYDSKLEKLAQWDVEYSNVHALIDPDKSSRIIHKEFEKELFNQELADVYREILLKLDIDIIHINHLINHSFDIFNLANEFDINYLVNIHDFYYCCPSIHLLDKNLNFCNLECCTHCAIDIDDEKKTNEIVKTWQQHCFKALDEAYLNIFPSSSTLELYRNFYPNLNNVRLIEHGRDIERVNALTPLSKNKIKIVFPGFISQHKGSLLINSIKDLDDDNILEFHFMGTTIPHLDCGINHGRYDREKFGKIIEEIRPDFIGLMSVCPETYSHTLTESISTGIPIIATDLGAQKERVEKYDAGWIVDHKNPANIYNTIINISEKDYYNKARNISNVKFKTFDEMIKEYNDVYEEIK